jgi:pimeloyl-ACP methyl ester carboxylesterase
MQFEITGPYHGETLIIEGGNSLNLGLDAYKHQFPNLDEPNVKAVPDAGHWVHYDKPYDTITLISEFLSKVYN